MGDVKCPYCGSECCEEIDLGKRPYWECKDKLCYASGPTNDPTGDKFMSLSVAIEAKDKGIAELEEKIARMGYENERLREESRFEPLLKHANVSHEKRDERLRVAAMMAVGLMSNLNWTRKSAVTITDSLMLADALIAEVDQS